MIQISFLSLIYGALGPVPRHCIEAYSIFKCRMHGPTEGIYVHKTALCDDVEQNEQADLGLIHTAIGVFTERVCVPVYSHKKSSSAYEKLTATSSGFKSMATTVTPYLTAHVKSRNSLLFVRGRCWHGSVLFSVRCTEPSGSVECLIC